MTPLSRSTAGRRAVQVGWEVAEEEEQEDVSSKVSCAARQVLRWLVWQSIHYLLLSDVSCIWYCTRIEVHWVP